MTKSNEVSTVNNITVYGICKNIMRHDNFLVFTHENPDADTIGSCFALVNTLRSLGKKAYPACGDRIPASLVFMTDGERDFHIENVPADFVPEYYISVDVASAAQLGKFHRLAVKHLGLCGIYLIEGFGRYAKTTAAEVFLYISVAVKHSALLT